MTLLAIGIALGFAHLFGKAFQEPKHRLMHGYFRAIAARLPDWPGAMLAAIALPALLVGAVQWLLLDLQLGLAAFVFATACLILAWGSRDLDDDVKAYLDAGDDAERAAAAEQLAFSYRQPEPAAGNHEVVEGVFYQGLVRWFGTIFWFVVLGAGGAVAFRLAHAMLCERSNRELLEPRQIGSAKRIVAVADWLPAVLATLGLAVVGDFDRVVRAWRTHFRIERRPWLSWDCEFLPRVGRLTVAEGQTLDDAFEHDYSGRLGQVNAAMSLVWRILVFWLTVIAVLTLVRLG